jgi:hypothetical protein
MKEALKLDYFLLTYEHLKIAPFCVHSGLLLTAVTFD